MRRRAIEKENAGPTQGYHGVFLFCAKRLGKEGSRLFEVVVCVQKRQGAP